MKKYLAFVVMLFATITLTAQNWTKQMQKEYRKSKDVAIVVDLSKATIMGVSIDKFPIYYAGKYKKEKEYAEIILEQIENNFKNAYRKANDLPVVDEASAKFVVHYDFNEITEEAAFSGVYYITCGDSKSKITPFSCNKGRWNDFETLIKENIEKFFKKLDFVG